MNDQRRRRLEAKGWKVGSTQEFLGLSDDEVTARSGGVTRPAHALLDRLKRKET